MCRGTNCEIGLDCIHHWFPSGLVGGDSISLPGIFYCIVVSLTIATNSVQDLFYESMNYIYIYYGIYLYINRVSLNTTTELIFCIPKYIFTTTRTTKPIDIESSKSGLKFIYIWKLWKQKKCFQTDMKDILTTNESGMQAQSHAMHLYVCWQKQTNSVFKYL